MLRKVVVVKCDYDRCNAEYFVNADGTSYADGWATRLEPTSTTHWCPEHADMVADEDVA